MASRYGGDPRYSDGALPYREAPPRWDRDTFAREREERYRGPPVAERERAYEEYRSPPRRGPEVVERRYVEEDRYGPRGSRVEKKYFEEEDYYNDPRAARGALIPFRERPEPPPPRPGGLLRRQSSLDTFDRQPARRYDDYDDRRGPPPPPPDTQRHSRPRYEERIYYDDVKVQEPDEGYREVREREWITQRRRDSSHSRERARSVVESAREEEVIEEKPFPRRGKTRMPKRIVRIEVLFDIGYPYHEEGEMIIIEKALSKELIDEVIERSRGYREVEEVKTIHTIQTPEIRETKVTEEITTVPLEEAPRSVRDWDALSVRSDNKSRRSGRSGRSHRSHSTHSRHTRKTSHSRRSSSSSSSDSRSELEVEKKTTIIERRPSRGGEEIIERRKTIIEEDGIDESNSVHVGPLALVVDRRKSRNDRDIKEEIRRLERERRSLREERRDRDVIKVERLRERSPSRNRAIIIEDRGEEVIEVRKDRRGPPPPSPGIIKAMMATLT